MTGIRTYRPGEFCWTDLGTTDVAAAKKFYQSLFGWQVKDVPMGMGDAKYSLFRLAGKEICALYPMFDDQKKMKTPPAWLPYVAVASASRAVTKAKAAGGQVCMKPMKVMDEGRMAIIQDPTGAAFAVWQAGTQQGAGLRNKPGTVCWHDLNTPHPAKAGAFYKQVFGWTTQDRDFSGNAYHLFTLQQEGVCGMWPVTHPKLPPSWITHWKVAHCAKTVAKARRLGGGVLMGTTVVPGMVRFALLTDPQGAVFGVIEE